MKTIIESYFGEIPESAQVALFGQYQDALAACETHPQLVVGIIEKLRLPPEFDATRPHMAAFRDGLIAALLSVEKPTNK